MSDECCPAPDAATPRAGRPRGEASARPRGADRAGAGTPPLAGDERGRGGRAGDPLAAPCPPPEPCTPAELCALVHSGLTDSDVFETLLAQSARIEGALDLDIGDGLAALCVGERLISLGFSSLRDYAREVLGIQERTAQAMVQLSRELRTRPRLRAAVRAGEVRPRNALTVLPVAVGDGEAGWVERARTETVRALEKAVREVRGAPEEEEWSRVRVKLSPEDRATVDEALRIAGKLLPGSRLPQRLEAMAQEYVGEHPVEAGQDREQPVGAMRRERADLEKAKARREVETGCWVFLPEVTQIATREVGSDRLDELTTAAEIDRELRQLAVRRASWDHLFGYCAYAVKGSGLWRVAGFLSFEHYCTERLGLGARTVEQRAALEKRIWEVPALRAARDEGLSYEKVRLLSRLRDGEVQEWIARARKLTCVALRAALEDRDEAQTRAAGELRARVPLRVALVLEAAFRAVRALEDRFLDDGRCLVRVAEHFIETWKPAVKKAKTLSQKVRERDRERCQVPGCSRRGGHGHHVKWRSRGGRDVEDNEISACPTHHLRGIHGGYIRVWGRAPHRLVWEVGGRTWKDGCFGTDDGGATAT